MNDYPRLKDLGWWLSGGTPPRDDEALWNGDLPWISAKDIDSTRLREPITFITEEAARRHSRVVDGGALLLIVRGMALAHGLPVVLTDRRVAFNQDLRALTPKPSIDSRFLHYAFIGNRHRFRAHIDQAAHGTARVIDSAYDERVLMPGLPAQEAIADFLNRESERVAKLDSRATSLVQRLHALLHSELHSLIARADASLVPISRLAAYRNGWPFKPEDAGDEGLPIVRIRQLIDEEADLDRFTGALPGAFRVDSGDLVFSWSGSLEVRYWSRGPAYLNQHLFRVDVRPGVHKRWMRWALYYAIHLFDAYMHGSAMKHITQPMMRNVKVPLPEPSRQHEVANYLDQREDGLKQTVTKSAELQRRLQEYRDALITEAVTGQLDVTKVSERQLDERAHAAMEGEPLEAVR